MMRWRAYVLPGLTLVATALLLLPLVLEDQPWPTIARDHLESRGVEESGALNTVSAIYLGYRAFDTLGETLVLLVAITGTLGIMGSGVGLPPLPALETGPRRRTRLLEVVTGKLGPVVLVFGAYVMLYGHVSPGGGFQGGVVVASGLVFLALGVREDQSHRMTKPGTLAVLEALAFILLVLAALAGMLMPGGFFSDPLSPLGFPRVSFIVALNTLIGIKVGTGMGFLCIAMLGRRAP